MPKKLLIETRMNALSLCEGVKPKRPGCLGTISGPCADYTNPTRNNNFYSRKLWENVFNDPLVKESLEDKVLLGELDHPGDRLETKAAFAAIVMTGYEFDDANGTVNGTFDILDTPNGRTLKSLLDYGCKIGVSSRGEGDVTTSEGIDNVDEDTYYFVGFDAVALPAVKKAKPALQESVKRETLKESLKSQINAATTRAELDIIKRVIEAAELPDSDSILESINNKSKELEGVNDSSNLMEDLEKFTTQNQSLLTENRNLKKEVATCKSRIQRFVESRVKSIDEESRTAKKLESLEKSNTDLMFKYSATCKKTEKLSSDIERYRTENVRLREELRTTRSLLSDEESKVKSLEESLNRSQVDNREKSRQIETLKQESFEYKEKTSKELEEGRNRERQLRTSLNESRKSRTDTLKEYAEREAKRNGIDPERILESVRPEMSSRQINEMIKKEVEKSDRYRKVPIVRDPMISLIEGTVTVPGKISEEDSQTTAFMEQFYKNY